MSVVNTNWAYAASSPATGVSTSITLDKAAGNNRMVVVTVAIFDNNSEVHTVTLDPGGTPVVATPLFDPSGRGIIKGADVVVNQVGIFYILDTDLPAGTGTFDVAVTWAAGVNNDTRIGVFYCEDMAQSVPALHGYTEHILTTDIATTISIAASSEVFEVLAQRENAQTFTAGVDNGNTVLFDHVNSTEPPQALSAYGTGETDLDWTLGTAANVMQAYAVFETLDVAAPVLTTPTYSGLTSFAVTPIVSTDDATGNMYYVIVEFSGSRPDITQVIAGTDGNGDAPPAADNQPTVGTGAQTFLSTGNVLKSGTVYVVYYAQVNGSAVNSNLIFTGFLTAGITQVGNIELVHTVGGEIDIVTPLPVLSSPAVEGITETSVIAKCTTDTDNGVMHMVVVPDGDNPDEDQIKLGLQSDGTAAIAKAAEPILAAGVHTFASVGGLTKNTLYEVFFVHTDDTNTDSVKQTIGFNTVAELFTNLARSTLASGILSGDLSLTVQSGDGNILFPAITGSDFFRCVLFKKATGDVEIITVSARSADVFTIARAQEEIGNITPAVAYDFDAGDVIELRPSAGFYTSLAIGATSANIQQDVFRYAPDTGSANNYQAVMTPTASAIAIGQEVSVKIAVGNTNIAGASTLQLDALGAVDIKMEDGANPPAGVIRENLVHVFKYDGTNFIMRATGLPMGDGNKFNGLGRQLGALAAGTVASDAATIGLEETLELKTLTDPVINGAFLSGTLSGSPVFSGNPIFTGVPVKDSKPIYGIEWLDVPEQLVNADLTQGSWVPVDMSTAYPQAVSDGAVILILSLDVTVGINDDEIRFYTSLRKTGSGAGLTSLAIGGSNTDAGVSSIGASGFGQGSVAVNASGDFDFITNVYFPFSGTKTASTSIYLLGYYV